MPNRAMNSPMPTAYSCCRRRRCPPMRKIKKLDLYLGCENIGNYKQEHPILAADQPFSTAFNSSVVWGPLMGRKFYIGLRWNLY